MRTTLLLTGLLLIVLADTALSQEYSYTHYDISDGLAGSTVYCITQDKEGFIWLGTETGVSRFDGTHFRTFTTKDGLPDVEVLEMFGDSRGRVWMAPFRRSICYYYKGKIYNQENDSVLRSLQFKGYIENFAEDDAGNILIQEAKALQIVYSNGAIRQIDSIDGHPITVCHGISRSENGQFLVQARDSLYSMRDGKFTFLHGMPYVNEMHSSNFTKLSAQVAVWRQTNRLGAILSVATGKVRTFPFHYDNYRHVSYSIVADTLVCSNESDGTTEYTLNESVERKFLPGIEVSRTFRDDDGNTWFTTMGQGVYRLNSAEFRNIKLDLPLYKGCSGSFIGRFGKELIVGTNRNSVFRYQLPGMTGQSVQELSPLERKRIVYVDSMRNGSIIYGYDFSLEKQRAGKSEPEGNLPLAIKKACLKNDSLLLIASSYGAFTIDINKFVVLDTIWKERTTTLFYHLDTTYIGTLNGLYRLTRGHQTEWLGKDIPFLRKRIAAIVESSDGVLWIASYDDAGIIGMKDNRIVRFIDQNQGLTSDICRTLTLQKDQLWVGTDKGLNRIDVRFPGRPIIQYTADDGLGSNVINSVFVDSSTVYVGTPAGLTYFDQTKVNTNAGCRLAWLDISSSGQSRIKDSANLKLPYNGNNIHFEYAGISYRSAGKMQYRYRLLGLDTAWRYTHQTFLDYPTLPSGEYILQIVAINKSGVHSQDLSIRFEVTTPFWKTVWFMTCVFLASFALIWIVVSMRIKAIRTRQKEEEMLARRISEMEHMALQAQMNPHFIFNCLNSIQQYIFDKDIFAANKYITGFSRLIRATLHNSSKSLIPLADEISYLANYLSLEQLRFKEKMDYHILVAPELDVRSILIPPMLVQPYVENSMRHGLRHKTDGKGIIRITVNPVPNGLSVLIEDNGIGRQMAARYKTVEHIEYQSRGMTLTAERIGLINKLYGEGIGVEVTDLLDSEGRPAGTSVKMTFPLFVTTTNLETYDQNYPG